MRNILKEGLAEHLGELYDTICRVMIIRHNQFAKRNLMFWHRRGYVINET